MSNFTFEPLELADLVLIRPRRFGDARGYFMETYSAPAFAAAGIAQGFVQDNQSLSAAAGVIRGLHFQRPPVAQAKLIRVLRGAILDVAVDLRRGSPDYGRCCSVTLTAESGEQLYVPRGFAHGFCTLEPMTEVAYKVDAPYAPAQEGGLAWDDPALAIDWPVSREAALLSDRDRGWPRLSELDSPFRFGDPS